MKKNERARAWLRQASSDLAFAKNALKEEFFAQACFIAQQCSEKALKSLLYNRGAKAVFSHSLHKLCGEARMNGELVRMAQILDQYYLSSRYPDALAEGAPVDVFTKKQAQEAVRFAQRFVAKVRKEVRD